MIYAHSYSFNSKVQILIIVEDYWFNKETGNMRIVLVRRKVKETKTIVILESNQTTEYFKFLIYNWSVNVKLKINLLMTVIFHSTQYLDLYLHDRDTYSYTTKISFLKLPHYIIGQHRFKKSHTGCHGYIYAVAMT